MTAVDWSARYRAADTPWDLGHAHPELARRIALGELAPPRRGARALVAGCGRGHDALALARAGWRVTALDLAPEVERVLGKTLRRLGGELVIGDAFAWRTRQRFALVFEHTFCCALDPALRPQWGAFVRRLLAARGRVCALVYPIGKPRAQGGPPFGLDVRALRTSLGAGFRTRLDAPVAASIARRQWGERWAEFERAPAPRARQAAARGLSAGSARGSSSRATRARRRSRARSA